MTTHVIDAVTLAAALGCALVAGLFLAFSVSVMPGLGRLPAEQAILAMQSFNAAIRNPVFGLVFVVAIAGSAFVAGSAPFTWDEPGAAWRLAGGLSFIVGGFALTMAINVPLNDALDAVDPHSATGAELWQHYRTRWTAWNHVRTLVSLAAAALLVLGRAT
ncbi:MAG: DUF1772 domain-containing protein [Actinomycetota bacterium]|nr:DUF1772 domain-containing protein [Actinomycetota bacterium]MDQ3627498.1 DUF1772 domain-containing protein [Actinomycetota bacterium]